MTSHNKPVSTIIEKANRTSCHRKNFICKHVEILILLRRLLQSENLNSPKGSNSRFIALHYARKISKLCLLFPFRNFCVSGMKKCFVFI